VVLRISPPRACKASGIALFTRLWRPRQSGGPNWAGDPANRRRAMVSDRLTDGWYGGTRNTHADRLSELLNILRHRPTSLGSAGRIVRCARRKTTWFADGAKPEPELTAVEAETYAERAFTGVLRPDHPVNSSGVEVEHRPVVEEAEIPPSRKNIQSLRRRRPPSSMRRRSYRQSSHRRIPPVRPMQTKSKTSLRAASACRHDASKHDARPAGRHLSLCCLRSMSP
jgi:hypothetical protein